ncbi:MAG TPA: helix-turn-helix domain-containing protein [Acidimicrobiales bacterium]|nr:helix-turn-helix domain-containing protein [Acidimicrobiales bacterium]
MPEAASILESLAPSRRRLVQELKRRGEASAEELAAEAGLTSTGVRQHMKALSDDGLVAHRRSAAGPGRPRHLYHLTGRGHGLFPAAYGELTNELLGYLSEADPSLVDAAFERRRQRRRDAAAARMMGLDPAGKVAELTRILDEDGYMAGFEQVDDHTWMVTEHNCAIFGVARRYGQACSSEIGFIREVLPEAEVERVTHMVAGAHRCSYRISIGA